MLYETKYGFTIEISTEKYLSMSDKELELYIEESMGSPSIADPWFGSSIRQDSSYEDYIYEDLTVIPTEEKLLDPDLDMEIEEE